MAPARAALLGAAGGVTVAISTVAGGPGRWLVGLAGLVLLADGLRGALVRPTLRATGAGLDVVVLLRREHLPWATVERIAPSTLRRRLVSSSWLEIDTGERVLALPAYRLGAAAADVAEAVSSRRSESPG
jgi:hypothetical protein